MGRDRRSVKLDGSIVSVAGKEIRVALASEPPSLFVGQHIELVVSSGVTLSSPETTSDGKGRPPGRGRPRKPSKPAITIDDATSKAISAHAKLALSGGDRMDVWALATFMQMSLNVKPSLVASARDKMGDKDFAEAALTKDGQCRLIETMTDGQTPEVFPVVEIPAFEPTQSPPRSIQAVRVNRSGNQNPGAGFGAIEE